MEGGIYRYVHLQAENTPAKYASDKMHSVICFFSLPWSLPDRLFPSSGHLNFPVASSLSQPAVLLKDSCAAEYYFPLAASRCETGSQGQWPHRKGQGIVPPPGTIAPASASVRMLTGTSSSPPTPGSKERPATQNHCLSLHDISSFSALLSLICNVGATESIWFCGAAE